MGSFDRMLQQIEVKMQAGYRCIKLKIGAINFEEELALLRHIRAHYSAREIELRVDANGAFSPADAMDESVGRIGPTFYRAAYPGRAVGGNGPSGG